MLVAGGGGGGGAFPPEQEHFESRLAALRLLGRGSEISFAERFAHSSSTSLQANCSSELLSDVSLES